MPPPPAASSPALPRPRRSRNGCIGCRKARVKCDEVKPRCGTCHRRSLVCPGYSQTRSLPSRRDASSLSPTATGSLATEGEGDTPTESPLSPSERVSATIPAQSPTSPADSNLMPRAGQTPARSPGPSQAQTSTTPQSAFRIDMLGSSLSLLPPGLVSQSDEQNITLYFNRHPFELVIGDEFVAEMNANTLLLLQQDPAIVANVLAAIGYVYLVQDSETADAPVLARRSRILSDLRLMKPSSSYFEMALHLLLALCAMELVTFTQPRQTTSIPMLLNHVSALITHHFSLGGTVSFVSRYLLRGLAREDFVVSLVSLRRFRVPTYAWLDFHEGTKPDRLMGYTATLMPLLEELCALAEDLRHQILQPYFYEESLGLSAGDVDQTGCLERAESLKQRIQSWQPPVVKAGPFKSTRKFHAQAACYRAGALLYLHRLIRRHPIPSPPIPTDPLSTASPLFDNSSTLSLLPSHTTTELSLFSIDDGTLPTPDFEDEGEAEALHKAHEILLSAAALPVTDVGLLLWPVFLAACEMRDGEDREAVLQIFNAISERRKTVTVVKTKAFVQDVVWRARDAGEAWNWMALAQEHPGECLPI